MPNITTNHAITYTYTLIKPCKLKRRNAKMVEQCSANAEAMGSNPVEVPNSFSGLFVIA